MSATLVLFSGSYPYAEAAESTFIGPELPHLAAAFDRVLLVPASVRGPRDTPTAEVEVSQEYAALEPSRLTPRTLAAAAASPAFLREVVAHPETIGRPAAVARVARYAGCAARTGRFLPHLLARRAIDPARTLFYTYWLGPATLGAGRFARRRGGRVVSRAHGVDLYHHRHDPPLMPFQRETLATLDALFLACDHARDYVRSRYDGALPPCEVHRLGVRGPGEVVNRRSEDGVLRVVSCAYLVPVKRMDLLVRGLADAGARRPDRAVEWVHFGGGPDEPALRGLADASLPANVSVEWRGTVPNDEVLAHYRGRPVDLFVSASASEGGVPVSMTEAQSHGIPAVAPRVGGIPDLLSDRNGVLLPENPGAGEIGKAVATFLDASDRVLAMREESRRICKERFDADANSARFAARLRSLVPG